MEIQAAEVKIKPIKKRKFQITIKGESPLVMHAWSEKAKAMVRMTPQERKKLPKVERTPEQTAHECPSPFWGQTSTSAPTQSVNTLDLH